MACTHVAGQARAARSQSGAKRQCQAVVEAPGPAPGAVGAGDKLDRFARGAPAPRDASVRTASGRGLQSRRRDPNSS